LNSPAICRALNPPRERSFVVRAIAECFPRLSNLDSTLLDRVGSYESRMWRQAAQTMWALDAMRRPLSRPDAAAVGKPVVPCGFLLRLIKAEPDRLTPLDLGQSATLAARRLRRGPLRLVLGLGRASRQALVSWTRAQSP